jgi:hypothetical protein
VRRIFDGHIIFDIFLTEFFLSPRFRNTILNSRASSCNLQVENRNLQVTSTKRQEHVENWAPRYSA